MSATDHERRSSGFRMIDLAILLAIVCILGGVVVLVIQKIRAASDRIACANNLHWIVLSCHSANDTYGTMPPFNVPVHDSNSYFGRVGNHGSLFFSLAIPF